MGSMEENHRLTAENCKDRSDNCTVWTDKKHNSYLNLLESSFVKRLHQSKGFKEKFSETNHGDANKSQKPLIAAHNSSEEFIVLRNGSWQKIRYERAEPLSHPSADSRASFKKTWIYRLKRKGLDSHAPAAETQDLLKVFIPLKHGEGIKSHGVATSSMELSASDPYRVFLDLTRAEGMGQNFLDEDNQNISKIEHQAKEVKEALTDSSCQDQTVPTTDQSMSHNSILEDELSQDES